MKELTLLFITQYFSGLEVKYLKETKDEEDNLKTKVKWISFKDQFFFRPTLYLLETILTKQQLKHLLLPTGLIILKP